jgi:SAM-dependent methyltransferase
MTRTCWCGSIDLDRFSDDYRICRRCGTLVSAFAHDGDVSRVRTDEVDLYGRDYWFGHMENDLGFANIYERARTDLTGRCAYWLKTLLKYQAPPCRVLELGSAHGGFVAMLGWAGFDAVGLELSPAIAQIARDLFHVQMLQGPVEDQHIEAGSLDVIVLMDVLEHLPDPLQTMRHCIGLLNPRGFLLIQTPKYPEGESLEAMREAGNRFVEQLKEQEHLYLFSARSVVELFAQLGCDHVSFEPAFFSHYDMFFTVSRQALTPIETTVQEERVMKTGAGRLIVAFLDLYTQLQLSVPRSTLQAIEDDRAARLEVIERQGAALGEAEGLTAQLRAQVEALQSALDVGEADRAARLAVIERQGATLGEAEQLTASLRAQVEALQSALDVGEADRAARLAVIERQGVALGEAGQLTASLRAQGEALQSALDVGEADRAARLEVILRQGTELGEAQQLAAGLRAHVEATRSALDASEADRAARLQVIERQGVDLGEAARLRGVLEAQVEGLQARLDAAEADRAARVDLIARQGMELAECRTRLAEAERLAARSILTQISDRLRDARRPPSR